MIGVALDKTEGAFHVFMRTGEAEIGKQVHVLINGEPMARLSLAALGGGYGVCEWQLEAGDLTRELNHLVFKCLKGGRVEVMRRLNLVVNNNDNVFVVSRSPVIMGGGDISTARVALPMGSPVDRIKRRAKRMAKAILRR
jgi:hypothetical protein